MGAWLDGQMRAEFQLFQLPQVGALVQFYVFYIKENIEQITQSYDSQPHREES